MVLQPENGIPALFHQPFRCRCCSTDTNRFDVLKPQAIDFLRTLNEMSVRIDPFALVEQHPSIATLPSTHKEYQVMSRGEG